MGSNLRLPCYKMFISRLYRELLHCHVNVADVIATVYQFALSLLTSRSLLKKCGNALAFFYCITKKKSDFGWTIPHIEGPWGPCLNNGFLRREKAIEVIELARISFCMPLKYAANIHSVWRNFSARKNSLRKKM